MGSSRFWLKVADEESNEFPKIPLVKGDRSVRDRVLPDGENVFRFHAKPRY